MRKTVSLQRLGVVVGPSILAAVLLAVVVPGLTLASPRAGPLSVAIGPASGTSEQFAFGGSIHSVYSCSTTNCTGGNLTSNQTLSISWRIDVTWVAIYTRTNLSPTQTEFEGRTAVGLSVSYGYSACVSDPTCQVASFSGEVHGAETSAGFTNITTGSVNLTAGTGSPAVVPALAASNATSRLAFNLSGTFSEGTQGPLASSISATFDVGGSESSAISFPHALGLVPVDVSPGDAWNASEPFTASGSYLSGYSYSATVNGTSGSLDHWAPGAVARSGSLGVNGTDLGATVLYDNYTSPPSTITAQTILLEFSGGNFTGSDGCLLSSTAVYDSLLNSFAGLTTTTDGSRSPTTGSVPTNLTSNLTSTESTFYVEGQGFVGASFAGNGSGLVSGEPGGPTISLRAGPEPLTVADSQYASITASPSSSGSPLLLIVLGVVVAVVVVAAAVLVVRGRSAKRPPPSPSASPTTTEGSASPLQPGSP